MRRRELISGLCSVVPSPAMVRMAMTFHIRYAGNLRGSGAVEVRRKIAKKVRP
jgi:hypothetical protein